MPVLNFDSLDAVPEGLREDAKAVEGGDGKVTVNVVTAKKLDDFRDNNIKLVKERDDLKTQLGVYKPLVGDDVEGFTKNMAELQAIAQRVKDGDLKESRSVEEALAKRTDEMRKDFETRLQQVGKDANAWRLKHDQLEGLYKRERVTTYIKDAALAPDSGINPKALNDIVRSGLELFRAEQDGRIVPYQGDAPVYGTDGSSPMTGREWIAKLREESPHYFAPTNGGGAGAKQEKTVHGRTKADLQKMSASELLALANGDMKRTR